MSTKGRNLKSLKVEKEIHAKLVRFKNQGMITTSLVQFTNEALKRKLSEIDHEQAQDILSKKIQEIQDYVYKLNPKKITELQANLKRLDRKIAKAESKIKSRKIKRKK